MKAPASLEYRMRPLLPVSRVWMFALIFVAIPLAAQISPGSRVLMDAHNCYPYFEWWSDRIDRALSAGTPLAIEQDWLWVRDPRTGKMASLVSHSAPATGSEPTMQIGRAHV